MPRVLVGLLMLSSSICFAQIPVTDAQLFGLKGPVHTVHIQESSPGSDQLKPESDMVFNEDGQFLQWDRFGRTGEPRYRRVLRYNGKLVLEEQETMFQGDPRRVVTTYNANGDRSEKQIFEPDGRLRERRVYHFTPDQIRVSLYDSTGKLVRENVIDVSESGDAHHHQIERRSEDKLLDRTTFDQSSGSLKTSTESFDTAGKKRELRQEDTSGSVVATVSPDGSTSAYRERPDGQITEMSDAETGTEIISKYNDLGQLVEQRSLDREGKLIQVRNFEYVTDEHANWTRSTEHVAVGDKVVQTKTSTRTITYY